MLNFLLLKNRFSEKRIFCHRNIFFLFASLFTLSFIVGLRLHYFIHYWKQCFNNYMTGVISKLKRKFKLNLSLFSSATPSHVLLLFEQQGQPKKQHFFNVYFMTKLYKPYFYETNIFL